MFASPRPYIFEDRVQRGGDEKTDTVKLPCVNYVKKEKGNTNKVQVCCWLGDGRPSAIVGQARDAESRSRRGRATEAGSSLTPSMFGLSNIGRHRDHAQSGGVCVLQVRETEVHPRRPAAVRQVQAVWARRSVRIPRCVEAPAVPYSARVDSR